MSNVTVDPKTGQASVSDYIVNPPPDPNRSDASHTAYDTITLTKRGRYAIYFNDSDNGLTDYEVDIYEGPGGAGNGHLIGQLLYGQVGEQERIYGFLGTDGSEVLNTGGLGTYFSPPGMFSFNSVNDGQVITLVAREYAQSYATIGMTLRVAYLPTQGPLADDFSVKLQQLGGSVTADALSHVDAGAFQLDPLTLTVVSQGQYGTAQVVNGKIVYTENSGLTKPVADDITYQVTDTAGEVSTVGRIHIKVGPDPYPINVDAVETLSDDATFATASASTGSPITLGRQDGLKSLITTTVGRAVITDASVQVLGTLFTPTLGGVSAPLFKGDTTFLASTQTATLNDKNLITDGTGFALAGRVFNPTSVKLAQDELQLAGYFTLPDELPLPRLNVLGTDSGVKISGKGVSVGTPIAIAATDGSFSFKGLLEVQGTQLSATYNPVDDSLRLQGKITITSIVQPVELSISGKKLTAVGDLTGDNYLRVAGKTVDVKGVFSFNNIGLTPGLEVSTLALTVETNQGSLKGISASATFLLAKLLGAAKVSLTLGVAFRQVDGSYYLDGGTLGFAVPIPLGASGLVFQAGQVSLSGYAPLAKAATADDTPQLLSLSKLEVSLGPKTAVSLPATFFTNAATFNLATADLTFSVGAGVDKSNGDFVGVAGVSGFFGSDQFMKFAVSGKLDLSTLAGTITGTASLLGGALTGGLMEVLKPNFIDSFATLAGNIPNVALFGGLAGKPVGGVQLIAHLDLGAVANDVVDLSFTIDGLSRAYQWKLQDILGLDFAPTQLKNTPLPAGGGSGPMAAPNALTASGAAAGAGADAGTSAGFVLTRSDRLILEVDWTNAPAGTNPGDPGFVSGTEFADSSSLQVFQLPLMVTYDPGDGSGPVTYHEADFGNAGISYSDDLSSEFTRAVVVDSAAPGTWSVAIDTGAIAAMGIDPSTLNLGTVTTDATIPVGNQPQFQVTGTYIENLNGNQILHVQYSATSGDAPASFRIYADTDASGDDGTFVTTIAGPAANTTVDGDFVWTGLGGGGGGSGPAVILAGPQYLYAVADTSIEAPVTTAYSSITLPGATQAHLVVTLSPLTPVPSGDTTQVDVFVTNASGGDARGFLIDIAATGGLITAAYEIDPDGTRTVQLDPGASLMVDESNGTLAAGGSFHFRLDIATVDDTLAPTQGLSLEASVQASDPVGDGDGNVLALPNQDPDISASDAIDGFATADAPDPALQDAHVTVSLSGGDTFTQGSQQFLRAFATVHNDGPDPATDVTLALDAAGAVDVEDPLGAAIGAANEADWFTVTPGDGPSWTIHFRQALAAGDTATLPLLFTPTGSGAALLTASVAQPGVDADTAGQTGTLDATIALTDPGAIPPDPDLGGSITVAGGQAQPVATVDLVVAMNGGGDADTVVDIAVPDGATLLSQGRIVQDGSAMSTAGSVTQGSSAGMLVWDAGPLLAGESVGIELELQLAPGSSAASVTAVAEDASSPAGSVVLDTTHLQPVLGTPDAGGGLFSLVIESSGSEGHPFLAQVPAGIATEPDGGALTFAADGLWPSTLSISPDGTISGTVPGGNQPNGTEDLTDGLRVVVSNAYGGHVVATVADTSIGYPSVDPPQAVTPIPDHVLDVGVASTWHVLQDFPWQPFGTADPASFDDVNIGDLDGSGLTYAIAGLPASLTFDPLDHTIDGTPTGADLGAHTVTVTATKAGGLSASQSFTLDIVNPAAAGAPPVAGPAPTLKVTAGQVVAYTLPAGTFTDPSGAPLTVLASNSPYWLSYDAASETFTGTAPVVSDPRVVVPLFASDGAGGTAASALTVTLDGLDVPPTVQPLTVGPAPGTFVAQAEPLVIPAATLLAAATPGEPGQVLTLGYGQQPTNGTLAINADGGVTYTPNPGFDGQDSFDFQVSDGTVYSSFATVTVNVPHVDEAPYGNYGLTDVTADPDTVAPQVVIADAADAGYDPDDGPDPLTVIPVAFPSQGPFTVGSDGSVTWQAPSPGFVGLDTFVFEVSDGLKTSDPVYHTVDSSRADGTAPPTLNPAFYSTPYQTPFSTQLPAASDPQGGSVTYALAAPATGGTATISPDGLLEFTPDDGFSGPAIVPLSLTDADGYVSDYMAEVAVQPACYLEGTRIGTPHAEVAVEDLKAGDLVMTASGQPRPVRWIGRRLYAGRFLAANPSLRPVRFRPGSLGDGLPRRDLLVSPNHSMLLNGVLVPARCLVNGSTITVERGLMRVDYYHVELDSHDVLLAEGAPSESFVDDGSRGMFHNAAEWAELYPGRRRVPAVFCAPRVESGPELEAIRRRLGEVVDRVAQTA